MPNNRMQRIHQTPCMHVYKMKTYIYTTLSILMLTFAAFGGASTVNTNNNSITLEWTPCANTVAYKCYYGSKSMTYTNVITVGNTTAYTISNLTANVSYYFAITSVNGLQLESDYSKEIHVYIKRK